MNRNLHLVSAYALIALHTVFWLRSFWLLRYNKTPQWFDTVLLRVFPVLFPLTAFLGILALRVFDWRHLLHGFAGILPLILFFLFSFLRNIKKAFPLLLPSINQVLCISIWLLGLLLC